MCSKPISTINGKRYQKNACRWKTARIFLYYLIFYFNDLFFFINFAFDFITALADEVDRFFTHYVKHD